MTSVDNALVEIEHQCGSGSVIRDQDLLETYGHDESETEPCVPEAVVRVGDTQAVASVMRAATKHGVPVTPRAGGTGRVGGAVPVPGGIVLAFEKMNRLKGIETEDLLAVAQPGVVTGDLHRTVEAQALFYPPDPNSLDSCAIGGNLAANAGGPRAFKYGVTREYVLGMEVVLADGTILQLGRRTPKGVTGYDLTALMIGSEGTLGLVTEATLRLLPKPDAVATLLVFVPTADSVSNAISAMLRRGVTPRCVELLDSIALDIVRRQAGIEVLPGASAMILVELDGEGPRLERDVEECGNAATECGAIEVLVAKHAGERERLWAARRELSHSLRQEAEYKLSEDVVVPRTRIAGLLQRCRELSDEHEIKMPTYGHAGDGNLHVNFLWNDAEDRPRVDAAIRGLFEAVLSMDGTLSGEHGIGVLKAPYLPMEQSPELIALQRRIKEVFDPKHILNPGKIFPAEAKRFHGAC